MTRASLVPFAWLLGGLLAVATAVATLVLIRFLRALQRDHVDLHAELGRPGWYYFLALGWLTPSRFGVWLFTRPESFHALPGALQRDATLLRRLTVAAFVLWAAAVAMVVASGFL